MAEKTTFIKIDRNIVRWRWYKDGNTFRLFVHLLLNANIQDHEFMHITVHRGEFVSSYPHLAEQTGLSVKNIRTALEHLTETGEVAVKRHSKFSVFTVLNYDYYQSQAAGKRQSIGRESAVNRQQYKNNKNIKNDKKKEKNKKESAAPAPLEGASRTVNAYGLTPEEVEELNRQ